MGNVMRSIHLPPGRRDRILIFAAVIASVAAGLVLGGGVLDLMTPATASPTAADLSSAGLAPTEDADASAHPSAGTAVPSPTPNGPGTSTTALTPAWALPTGWRYDLACGEESSVCALHLYDAAGTEQDGWPVTIKGDCESGVTVGPRDSAFVACTREDQAVITGLNRTGRALPGWPVRLRGTVGWSSWNDFAWGGKPSIEVGPDGTVYVPVVSGGDGRYRIHALAPDASPRKGWPRAIPAAMQGFTVAPDGAIVAWWYEGVEESIDLQARRTRFTMIGANGRTLPGWPIGSRGAASGPLAFGDGSIYYVSATGKVWGHDRTGKIMKGWPFLLPYPIAPALRPDGALLFIGDSEVIVVDRRGRRVTGWPYRTRATLTGPDCDTPGSPYPLAALSPSGRLYLAEWDGSRASITALEDDGRTPDGWPYRVPVGWRVAAVEATDEGTVTATLSGDVSCGSVLDQTAIRLSAGGKLVGDAPPTPLSMVYKALRLDPLRTTTGSTAYAQGAGIELDSALVNTSSATVTLPRVDYNGDLFYAAGTIQTWIERVGPDPEVDCLPSAGRKGTWYATGGWINVSGVPVTIPPGGRMAQLLQASLSPDLTRCLPPGAYRYHLEYKPLGDDEDVVIDEETIVLRITAGTPSTPPSTPQVTPRPTPMPTATPGPPAAPPSSSPALAAT
jgi:hypothetical protein